MSSGIVAETVAGMDAGAERTGMYSQRVSVTSAEFMFAQKLGAYEKHIKELMASSLRKRKLVQIFFIFLGIYSSTFITKGHTQENDQQQSRIDFGNAYIQGQSIKSGAVYLTNRRKSKLKSLLKDRESYRFEILHSYYNGDYEEPEDANTTAETIADTTAPVNE